MSSLPPSWSDAVDESEQRQIRVHAVPCWQRWRLPLLLALLGHASIGLLLVQHTWQRPLSPEEPARAIEAYFYQPPPVVSAAEPEEPAVTLEMQEEAAAITAEHTETPADATTPTTGLPKPSDESASSSQSLDGNLAERRGSMMDRALQQLQSTGDLANAHRTQQLQRHAQPKITVEKRYQEIHDGSQPIRNSRGCLSGDPSVDGFGFDGLMAAKYVPCGDEISAGQQLQEILQRRSRHLGRSE
ncbi:hypothetical protein [Alkalimonas amylolytica]|uniref:Uncharacterized protein n=1 Tax=Alkalimonas amylolytica TaxID=152573 RepID=A0A1H4EH16_ALKAM|nr:hypothetical protein [Alkalimonas amylolytica]SEA84226.1 hypothetical protein SAMN04488051_10722 [Alkalimonas amylolytica]